MLKVGDKAPDFSGIDDEGNPIALKDFKGKKIVLYFYPQDNTETCTKEACEFRDAHPSFKRLGVPVIGVSPDSAKKHTNFKKKYKLPFPLIADTDLTICNAYGVWGEKTTFGRTYMGVIRTTFVIDEKGKIADIFSQVRVNGHTKEVLDAVKQ